MTQTSGPESGILTPVSLHEKIERVRGRAESLYRRSKDRAVELEGHFEDYIAAHPAKSMLIATGFGIGVGVLLNSLLKRR